MSELKYFLLVKLINKVLFLDNIIQIVFSLKVELRTSYLVRGATKDMTHW